MKRGIEITCNDSSLLPYLADQDEWTIKKVENTFYLISPAFDGLATLEEVWQAAEDEIFVINGILKYKYRYVHLIRGTAVATFDDKGDYVDAATSKDWAMRAGVSSGIKGFRDADAVPLTSTQILQLAQKDDNVREALQHYSNEHNWFNLYKVYEIIQKETCRAEAAKTVKRGTFDKWIKKTKQSKLDFTESANKGFRNDGRHSAEGYDKSTKSFNYITLSEGEHFVIELLSLWLLSK